MTCVFGHNHATEHHIFPGTGNRKICDDYGVVVPLCCDCHTGRYGYHNLKSKARLERWRVWFCNYLKLDYELTLLAVNNKSHRGYLEEHKERLLKIRREKYENM